ncbi:unnamed protein product [Dibothriocephalus latus]|uniref:Reverse transcriptase domain-containing protein n=1 Tax=Dibothriocephalus latus TaxID=60516 RepID=A0A3P7NK97_DIBLA|nr:unnamed protein product [Dibothriocephalus latus]
MRHDYQYLTAVCFVDFVAAFDSADHEFQWLIMELDGVQTEIIAMIKAYYDSTNARVLVHNNIPILSISSLVVDNMLEERKMSDDELCLRLAAEASRGGRP